MIYPHNEAKYLYLKASYREELEAAALKKVANREYQSQAIQFLIDTGTYLDVACLYTEDRRDVYCVKIGKPGREYVLFQDFKQSIYATEKHERLTAYDVLAYVSMYTHRVYDTADDVYDSFGDMSPSKCQAVLDEQNRCHRILSALYTQEQLVQLSEIQ